jgi:hypothetical protein
LTSKTTTFGNSLSPLMEPEGTQMTVWTSVCLSIAD